MDPQKLWSKKKQCCFPNNIQSEDGKNKHPDK